VAEIVTQRMKERKQKMKDHKNRIQNHSYNQFWKSRDINSSCNHNHNQIDSGVCLLGLGTTILPTNLQEVLVERKSMRPQCMNITSPLNIFILFNADVIKLLDRLCCISDG
jgi:hypothetical protein